MVVNDGMVVVVELMRMIVAAVVVEGDGGDSSGGVAMDARGAFLGYITPSNSVLLLILCGIRNILTEV